MTYLKRGIAVRDKDRWICKYSRKWLMEMEADDKGRVSFTCTEPVLMICENCPFNPQRKDR